MQSTHIASKGKHVSHHIFFIFYNFEKAWRAKPVYLASSVMSIGLLPFEYESVYLSIDCLRSIDLSVCIYLFRLHDPIYLGSWVCQMSLHLSGGQSPREYIYLSINELIHTSIYRIGKCITSVLLSDFLLCFVSR